MAWTAAARVAAAKAIKAKARAKRLAAERARGLYRYPAGWTDSKGKALGGKFMSKAAAARQRGVESYLRAQLGAPPAGKQWAQIAGKYPERFADYLQDMNR